VDRKLRETPPAHTTQLQIERVLVAGVVHHPVPSRLLVYDYTGSSIGVHHVVGDEHPGSVLAAVASVHDDAVAVRVVGGAVVLPGYDVVGEYVVEAAVPVVEVGGDDIADNTGPDIAIVAIVDHVVVVTSI